MDIETGQRALPWEKQERLVSISDGMANCFLLLWILNRRLQAATESPFNLEARVRWCYEEATQDVVRTLLDYGYDLAFLERDDARSVPKRLVPLATHDPIEAQLARGTGRALLSDRCRRDATVSRLPCRAAR